ncbi:MAG: HemK/PrmC family methyltransferase [Ilumatobacteraceae bacterium]
MDAGEVVERLRRAGCVAAEEEAAELCRAAGGDAQMLAGMLDRREGGEPLAWVVGGIDFGGRRIAVDPGVYVPRAHTVDLVRRAAALLGPGGRAVDLCTGCGAVAAALGGVGVDLDPRAVACARRNGVPAVVADVAAVPFAEGMFGVVTAVPPYVPTAARRLLPADVQAFEPSLALDGGPDGLAVVASVIGAAARLLRPGGWLLVEIGGDQGHPAAEHLHAKGFVDVDAWTDDDGDLRGILARAVR